MKTAKNNGWVLCEDAMPKESGYYPALIMSARGNVELIIMPCDLRKGAEGKEEITWLTRESRLRISTWIVVAWYPARVPLESTKFVPFYGSHERNDTRWEIMEIAEKMGLQIEDPRLTPEEKNNPNFRRYHREYMIIDNYKENAGKILRKFLEKEALLSKFEEELYEDLEGTKEEGVLEEVST